MTTLVRAPLRGLVRGAVGHTVLAHGCEQGWPGDHVRPSARPRARTGLPTALRTGPSTSLWAGLFARSAPHMGMGGLLRARTRIYEPLMYTVARLVGGEYMPTLQPIHVRMLGRYKE